ncbi:MAG: hypothetical protein ACE5EY_03890 [Anaerolineae bacterium]
MKLLPEERKEQNERADYEAPAIIYEGVISTRAGSPTVFAPKGDAVDPADLFNN